MSSVNAIDRKKSRVEFDNAYFKIYDDAIRLIKANFGADKEIRETHSTYISVMATKVLKIVTDIGTHIRIANSIYPIYKSELEERRIAQGKAIGLCFDLLTKYQLIMRELQVEDDKFSEEVRHIGHEIKSLKNWRTSDQKRFGERVI